MTCFVMPFGKYKGIPLPQVPQQYLLWLLDNCDLRPALRQAIEVAVGIADLRQEFADLEREVCRLRRVRDQVAAELLAMEQRQQQRCGLSRGVIDQWYRGLARRFHPDFGEGSNEQMKAINAARDSLLELLGKL